MEQTIHTPETYDFRKYDQIWRRVARSLEPYPDLREPACPRWRPWPRVPHRGLPSRRP